MNAMYEQMIGVVRVVGGVSEVVEHFGSAARVRKLEGATAEEGSLVLVELRSGTSAVQVGDLLAKKGSSQRLLYDLLAAHKIDPLFPEEVREETARLVANPGFDDPTLTDLTPLPFVTIDNHDSRDLDQAIFLRRQEGSGESVEVFYALADASYYIKPGSALFKESLRRGVSYYLPGMSVPMLPRALSEDLISLNEGKQRRALVCHVVLDGVGDVKSASFFRALMKSRRKLTYDGVQAFYDNAFEGPLADEVYSASLMLMKTVGERLMRQAAGRGVVRFHRRSTKISVGSQGFEVEAETRNDVERWNEQLSLLCNMEGSKLLSAPKVEHVQPVFRVHQEPPQSQLVTLSRRVSALVEALGLERDVWGWEGPSVEPMATWLARVPMSPPGLRGAIERQAMMLGTGSSFTSVKGPHYGLGATEYGRFSSPMRELVGIFSHKELIEKLTGPDPAHDIASDEALRESIISASNRAKSQQRRLTREVQRKVLDLWFEADLEQPEADRRAYNGTVLSMRSSRLYVQLDMPPLELKVYTAPFAERDGGETRVDRDKVKLTRETGVSICLGDRVVLKVVGYDEGRGRWLLFPC